MAAARPDGLFWFFRTPDWSRPFLLMGCIAMLPIAGQIALIGWYLAVRDNLRRGWHVLPPAGFHHLERGVRPWGAALVYGLVPLPLLGALLAGAVVAALAGAWLVAGLLAAALVTVWAAVTLLTGFLGAALYDVADARGFGAALDPRRLWSAATADPHSSWGVYGGFVLGGLLFLGISLVTLPILSFVPFGGFALNLALPGVYLLAAPAQAAFRS